MLAFVCVDRKDGNMRRSLFSYLFFGISFLGGTFPAVAGTAQAHTTLEEVSERMVACTDIRNPGAASGKSWDDCCLACANEISMAARETSGYMRKSLLTTPLAVCLMVAMSAGACLFLFFIASRRRFYLARWLLVGSIGILLVASILGPFIAANINSEEEADLVTADRRLRGLASEGLIPIGNQRSAVYCPEVLKEYAARTDNRCGSQLLKYGGVFQVFTPYDERSGQSQQNMKSRLEDASNFITRTQVLNPAKEPASAREVLKNNDYIYHVADEVLSPWHYLWFQSIFIFVFGGIVAWALAFSLSYRRRRGHLKKLA
jgi:hypothetical protein